MENCVLESPIPNTGIDEQGFVVPPFEKSIYEERLHRVRNEMAKYSVNLFLCTCPNNIYYLTNYQSPGNPFTALVITYDTIHIITRKLEYSNVKYRTCIECTVYLEHEDPIKILVSFLNKMHAVTVGYESSSTRFTVRWYNELRSHDFYLVDLSFLIDSMRHIKCEKELEYMRKAATFVSKGHDCALFHAKPGISELNISGLIYKRISDLGSEYPSYPLFVSSGITGCMAHFAASRNIIKQNDVLFIELGACFNRYHVSKMSTIYIGKNKPKWYEEAENILKNATKLGAKHLKPGALAKDVDYAMRSYVSKWIDSSDMNIQMSDRSGYGIGIGLGTDWNENSQLCIHSESDQVVKLNSTVHVIPWVQIEGIGSIGFSDTVLVTQHGGVSLFENKHPFSILHNKLPKASKNCFSNLEWSNITTAIDFHKDTPKTKLHAYRNEINHMLYFKNESNRMNQRSFKVLGVSYAVNKLMSNGKLSCGDTVSSMTDGNHGEALAYVSQTKLLKCVIFVPHNTSEERIATIKELGAAVRKVDGTYDECISCLQKYSSENDWKIISDTAWDGYEEIPRYIAYGYCTIFKEAIEQIGSIPSHLFIQCGVGGLLTAAIMYMKEISPLTKIICVEPTQSACVYENILNKTDGAVLASGNLNSNMQGLNCGTPSKIAWPYIRQNVEDFIVIDDYYATLATKKMFETLDIGTNPSGASSYGAYLAISETEHMKDLEISENSSILFIVTEGVTDTVQFKNIVC